MKEANRALGFMGEGFVQKKNLFQKTQVSEGRRQEHRARTLKKSVHHRGRGKNQKTGPRSSRALGARKKKK